MAAKKKDESHPLAPVIRIAPLGELRIYNVTEEELDSLGRGSLGSIYLSFALALLPLSGSFLITLLTTTIGSVGGLVFFISACIISFLAGLLCLFLAWRSHVSTKAVIGKIKNRMPPPPPIAQQASDVGTAADSATVSKSPDA